MKLNFDESDEESEDGGAEDDEDEEEGEDDDGLSINEADHGEDKDDEIDKVFEIELYLLIPLHM